jgi:hypothetical protein
MIKIDCKPLQIWSCKIGECPDASVPCGADNPMRDAVADAYKRLTGHDPSFIFSGWNDELTEYERAAHENRIPNEVCEIITIPRHTFDQAREALNHLLYANHKPCLGCDGCNNARTTLAAME